MFAALTANDEEYRPEGLWPGCYITTDKTFSVVSIRQKLEF